MPDGRGLRDLFLLDGAPDLPRASDVQGELGHEKQHDSRDGGTPVPPQQALQNAPRRMPVTRNLPKVLLQLLLGFILRQLCVEDPALAESPP